MIKITFNNKLFFQRLGQSGAVQIPVIIIGVLIVVAALIPLLSTTLVNRKVTTQEKATYCIADGYCRSSGEACCNGSYIDTSCPPVDERCGTAPVATPTTACSVVGVPSCGSASTMPASSGCSCTTSPFLTKCNNSGTLSCAISLVPTATPTTACVVNACRNSGSCCPGSTATYLSYCGNDPYVCGAIVPTATPTPACLPLNSDCTPGVSVCCGGYCQIGVTICRANPTATPTATPTPTNTPTLTPSPTPTVTPRPTATTTPRTTTAPTTTPGNPANPTPTPTVVLPRFAQPAFTAWTEPTPTPATPGVNKCFYLVNLLWGSDQDNTALTMKLMNGTTVTVPEKVWCGASGTYPVDIPKMTPDIGSCHWWGNPGGGVRADIGNVAYYKLYYKGVAVSTVGEANTGAYCPIPTPTEKPEPPPPCPYHSIGDANCDDYVAYDDYLIWRSQYLLIDLHTSADFDLDHVVSFLDFTIWKNGSVLRPKPTPTPIP